jgi:hypothetical protein
LIRFPARRRCATDRAIAIDEPRPDINFMIFADCGKWYPPIKADSKSSCEASYHIDGFLTADIIRLRCAFSTPKTSSIVIL